MSTVNCAKGREKLHFAHGVKEDVCEEGVSQSLKCSRARKTLL